MLVVCSSYFEEYGSAKPCAASTILINTLGLQEAKDSSEIENIITTHDELYKSALNLDHFQPLQAKEVQNYISALKIGFELINKDGLLTNSIILKTTVKNLVRIYYLCYSIL